MTVKMIIRTTPVMLAKPFARPKTPGRGVKIQSAALHLLHSVASFNACWQVSALPSSEQIRVTLAW